MDSRRILLKLSGEALSGEGERGFAQDKIHFLIQEIKEIVSQGICLGLVSGAGNIFRGREMSELSYPVADQIGMLGTVINALYLKDRFEQQGVRTVVVSQIASLPSIRPIHYDDINLYFDARYVVVFAGGTSNPFFTTDTAAALRAVEMKADLLVKATKVDGIYDKDPNQHADAVRIPELTYTDAIDKKLKIMDTEAFSICQRYHMPIQVIEFFKKGNLLKAIQGQEVGSRVQCAKEE